MIDRKGIFSFLLITFAITYAVEFAMFFMGVRFDAQNSFIGQVIVFGVMWVPAFATVITAKFVTREGFAETGLRVGKVRPYLIWAGLMPILFALIYALTWGFGLHQPDWEASAFIGMMEAQGADLTGAPPPGLLLGLIFGTSVITVPFVNGLIAFGEEFGWRGYLLPKLMPLGKPMAYLLLGVIWSLWHLPLILMGFTYPTSPLIGVLLFTCITTFLGVILNELTLRHKSSILAGWVHGLFNSQKLGLWAIVFYDMKNVFVGGYQGLIGVAVWAVVAGIVLYRNQGKKESTA